jgi:hypothetical protein
VTLALDDFSLVARDKRNNDKWTPLYAAAHQHIGAEALKQMVAVITKMKW